jgi:Stress responsive A/B Barrel Domain
VIAHIVLFEPRPDLSDAERQHLVEGIRAAAREIPSVQRLRVGRRVRHGIPGYEEAMRDDYSFAAIIEFQTVEALREYLAHPGHQTIGRHFSESSVRALAYDYALVEADDVSRLAGS